MKKWYIATDGISVFHYGSIDDGQVLTTGQPELEAFTDEASFLTRLTALSPDDAAKYLETVNTETE